MIMQTDNQFLPFLGAYGMRRCFDCNKLFPSRIL